MTFFAHDAMGVLLELKFLLKSCAVLGVQSPAFHQLLAFKAVEGRNLDYMDLFWQKSGTIPEAGIVVDSGRSCPSHRR